MRHTRMSELTREDEAVAAPPPAAPLPAEPSLAPDAAQLRAALRAAVLRVCPPWLADRADDLVQAATIRVLEIRRRREGEADFSPFYLRKVAYCALVDEIRKLRRRREVPLEEEAEGYPAVLPPADLPDPERNALGREIGRAIRGCLAGMIRPRRMAVALYLQGHGSNEVGRLLGWAPKKAENLIYRGLADLRGCLAAKGIER